MRTLYITLVSVALMALIIPLHRFLAVSSSSPSYTHFVYMFGHASLIHWAVNSWCIIMLHHHFRVIRMTIAWGMSVILSFVYYPSLPVLGASVIISFFMGLTAPWLYAYKRLAFWQMLLLMTIGCFLPHIAGVYHVVLFVLGFIYAKVESVVNSIIRLRD